MTASSMTSERREPGTAGDVLPAGRPRPSVLTTEGTGAVEADPEIARLDEDELLRRIDRLRREREAVILAHNYQIPAIQDLADFVGDSLQLSQQAGPRARR